MTATTPQLRAALAAGRRGWPVLPCWPIREGRCACKRADCVEQKKWGRHPSVRSSPTV